MKIIKQRFAGLSIMGIVMALALTAIYAPAAMAHGEKSQAAFMRMRTIHWYDISWFEKDSYEVNESTEYSGKFYVFPGWPETVDEPDVAFLNVGEPGPVFIRTGAWVGGKMVPRSIALELGETYEWRITLKARRPGDWHVHPMLSVKGGGPIIGPGKWVTITGSMRDFKNPVTTLTGLTMDLETYNLGNTVFWSALWYIIGVAWMVYWCVRPIFIPRYMALQAGKEDELITPRDKKVGMAFMAGTIFLVAYGMASTNSKYPITTPLQAGVIRGIEPIEIDEPTVKVSVIEGSYRVPGRAMEMKLEVTNNGDSAVQLGEFNTASVRFLDPAVLEDDSDYPEDLLAEEGLTVDDNSPLQPGETRIMTVTASDAAWEVYRLADIIYDPDSRFAGLLFFFDESGGRQLVHVDAPLIPSFM